MTLFRRALKIAMLATTAMVPTAAMADPISALIVTAIHLTGTAAAVATFVLTAALLYGASLLTNALFGPKNRQAERQASVLQLSIGEVPREALFGKTATGGSLNDAGNYGGTFGTDWELLIITVADHKCASLEGFYVNDSYVAFTGDGAVSGYNGQLEVYWRNGSASQTLPSIVTNIGWSDTEDVGGSALIVVAYKADAPDQSSTVFNARPSFLWVVKGKLCYDPRKDSTVGGSGAHRWATPSTWEWTDNLSVCRYNWVRGIYAKDQVTNPAMLLVGRGLTSIEAPESNVFAYANVCDENVALAAGGSVKRYTFNGVIRADEKYVDTERKFAECCAGIIVQPGGAVEVEPGQARSITATITDDDLVSGESVQWSPFRSAADSAWVNTVVASYAEPTQKYQDHAAPVRRYTPDLTADGGPREQRLSLSSGITNVNQASRVAEIVRRIGRLPGSASITLPPRFAGIAEGDWIEWTSARRFGGLTKTFRVEAYGLGQEWRNQLSLREIAASCFSWTTADETASTAVAVPQTPPPGGWIRGYDKVDFATQVIGTEKPEINADVTANAVPSVVGNGEFAIDADYTGATITTPLPFDRVFKAYQGTTDVSATTNWVLGGGYSALALTVNNTPGSGSRGTVTVEALSTGSGTATLTATLPGGGVIIKTLNFTKTPGDPPSGGGSGSPVGSFTALSSTSSTTAAVLSSEIQVRSDGAGKIKVSMDVGYTAGESINTARSLFLNVAYATTSGGSLTDLFADTVPTVTPYFRSTDPVEYNDGSVTLALTQYTMPAANTDYFFKVKGRSSVSGRVCSINACTIYVRQV